MTYSILRTRRLWQSVEPKYYKFTKFGRDFAKNMKLSPDGFVQAHIQRAYYKSVHPPQCHHASRRHCACCVSTNPKTVQGKPYITLSSS